MADDTQRRVSDESLAAAIDTLETREGSALEGSKP